MSELNTGCVHPLKVSGTQRWLQLRCVKALLLIGCYTTTTCFGWNSATNLASGWEDFRNSSHYLYVLHHGHLLLLKPKNLLLVWLVDVGHLVILRPIPSAHLTARSRWFVPVRAHGTGPAMLHTHTHTHTDHVDTFRLSHTADRMCDAQFVSWPQVQEPQVVWQLSAVLEEEEEEWVDTLEEDLSSRLHPRPALWAKAAMTAWTPWCLWKDCHSNGTGFWLLVVSSCNQGRSCT